MPQQQKQTSSALRRFFSKLGPGLVTGAADDDPSGIVTYSQSGAAFGLGQLWMALFMLPFMVAVQEMCARIGLVTGKGVAKILRENYSKTALYLMVSLLLFANVINLGADLGAMSAVSKLFINLPLVFFAAMFFCIILILEIFVSYHKYAKILKWLSITLLSYVLTGLIVAYGHWQEILRATFVPQFHFNFAFLFLTVGVLGTTISPYMFFWEAEQEVEEKKDKLSPVPPRRATHKSIRDMRIDNFSGMFFSNLATWFIIITTGLVLHKNGVASIATAADAAKALEPLVRAFPYSGKIAEGLFALGVIGTGLLAIPIFAATSSYAVAEIFNWHEGLAKTFKQARGFYLIIALGTFLGFLINLFNVNPMKALVITAIINGVVAVPMIFMLWRISSNKKIMDKNVNGMWSNVFVFATFLAMALAAILSFYQMVK